MARDWLSKLVVAIALITIVSGAAQMIWPGFVLGIVGAAPGLTANHFFAIVGMFMALFGGLALHGVYAGSAPALLWAALQKFGAVGAVGLGVWNGVFSALALAVAGFDLLSALVLVWYWRRLSTGHMAK